MAVVAVMTGAPGTSSAPPTTGVHGSFLERVSFFGLFATLALGAVPRASASSSWLIVSVYRPRSLAIRRAVDGALGRSPTTDESQAIDADRSDAWSRSPS